MKKIIQILLIVILVAIILLVVVFSFDLFDYRTKFISYTINNFLSEKIDGYTPLPESGVIASDTASTKNYNTNPLLNSTQEKQLEDLGVDVSQLPTSISPTMQQCLIQAVGQTRADEIVAGSAPSALEVIKARNCL